MARYRQVKKTEMIELAIGNISKTYPNRAQALRGINRVILLGLCFLLASNDGMKHMLMRVLATLYEPDKGQFFFEDSDVVAQLSHLLQFILDTMF